jgi:hypothetical protein
MLIKDKSLRHWINYFYGYGSWEAKIWFVAYEESGGDFPEEVSERLNYFSTIHASGTTETLCDIRDLYRQVTAELEGTRGDLFKNLYEYRFGPNAIIHGIWKNLIAFVHGYKGEKLPELLHYQKNHFAMTSSHEALINLYPLPSTHNHAWYYSWLQLPDFPFLKRRALYEHHVYQNRIHSILQNIDKYKPEVVLMYDMNNINTLKQSVQEYFPSVKFRMVKAIKQQIPQHHRADFNGTTMLITTQTPALKHNRIETGFDWYDLGKRVKSDS